MFKRYRLKRRWRSALKEYDAATGGERELILVSELRAILEECPSIRHDPVMFERIRICLTFGRHSELLSTIDQIAEDKGALANGTPNTAKSRYNYRHVSFDDYLVTADAYIIGIEESRLELLASTGRLEHALTVSRDTDDFQYQHVLRSIHYLLKDIQTIKQIYLRLSLGDP